MEPYIQMNMDCKKVASGFEDLNKLMKNRVFGKTMENLSKCVDIKLVHTSEDGWLWQPIASPAFARANIFDDDLAAIQVHKSRFKSNSPIYIGMCILDISRHLVYDFYYKEVSTVGSCKWTPTAYFLRSRRRMCIKKWPLGATYMTPPTSLRTTCYTAQRAKRMRKTKDECTGRLIAEYVGLRPKMYSIHEADGINIKN